VFEKTAAFRYNKKKEYGMITFLNNLDGNVLLFMQTHFQLPLLNDIMILFTTIGNKGLLWIVMALLLLISKKTRYIGVVTLGALVLSAIAGEGLLKHLVARPRPYTVFPGVQLLVAKATTSSFPSGHTTASFAAAFVLCRYLKPYAPLFWTLAIVIAFSRLCLFMHYPSDVLAGAVLGLICGKVATLIYEQQFRDSGLHKNSSGEID
jgi:undecaprenyl-diphosphatase